MHVVISYLVKSIIGHLFVLALCLIHELCGPKVVFLCLRGHAVLVALLSLFSELGSGIYATLVTVLLCLLVDDDLLWLLFFHVVEL